MERSAQHAKRPLTFLIAEFSNILFDSNWSISDIDFSYFSHRYILDFCSKSSIRSFKE